jgi:hypothetical protein
MDLHAPAADRRAGAAGPDRTRSNTGRLGGLKTEKDPQASCR